MLKSVFNGIVLVIVILALSGCSTMTPEQKAERKAFLVKEHAEWAERDAKHRAKVAEQRAERDAKHRAKVAEQRAEREALRTQFLKTIPICSGLADCKAKWEAAQLWVVHNAGYKIQTVTDVFIETYSTSPNDFSGILAASVTKEPLGNGSYKILIEIFCAHCESNVVLVAGINFNKTVGAATP